MTRWQPGTEEFTVSVTYHETRGCQGYLPKPVTDMLGRPPRITYGMVRDRMAVEAADQAKARSQNQHI